MLEGAGLCDQQEYSCTNQRAVSCRNGGAANTNSLPRPLVAVAAGGGRVWMGRVSHVLLYHHMHGGGRGHIDNKANHGSIGGRGSVLPAFPLLVPPVAAGGAKGTSE